MSSAAIRPAPKLGAIRGVVSGNQACSQARSNQRSSAAIRPAPKLGAGAHVMSNHVLTLRGESRLDERPSQGRTLGSAQHGGMLADEAPDAIVLVAPAVV